MSLTVFYILAIVLLIACSSFFSMSETAFTCVSEIKLKKLANEGDRKAEKTLRILENYDKFLTTILIGNNLVNIAGTSLATLVFSILLGAERGAVASTVAMTLVILAFGEITPKSIAKRNPEKVCMAICSAVRGLMIVLTPLSWLFIRLTRLINRNHEDQATLTEDELEVMIDEIQSDGVLEESEGELIKSAMRFDDIQVSEVYVPRMDVVAVDADAGIEELEDVINKSGFSRIPVFEGSIDNIVGVLYSKEYLIDRMNGKTDTVRELVRPVSYVPETTNIADLLSDFQKTKIHMAIVLDSYGGTKGIVTMEDLLEELVGEIWDESDEVQQDIVKVSDDTWKVKGIANIYDVMHEMDCDFDPEEYEDYSVTGYIFYKLGRGPAKGDSVETDEVTITVKSVKKHRVIDAEFVRKPHSERDGDGSD